MKRSEIKRKTPLKSSGPVKKRKKKTALQKRIDKMDSPYWNNKCKAAVAEWAHLMPCLICTVREQGLRDGQYIVGHHLIRKSKSRLYRWHPDNIVPLCPKHHLHGIDFAAHSENVLAVVRFIEAFRALAPTQYDWLVDHQDAIRKTDMRGPIERPNWAYQYTIWQQRAADARILQENDNEN